MYALTKSGEEQKNKIPGIPLPFCPANIFFFVLLGIFDFLKKKNNKKKNIKKSRTS